MVQHIRNQGPREKGGYYKNDDWKNSRIGEKHKPMNPRTEK